MPLVWWDNIFIMEEPENEPKKNPKNDLKKSIKKPSTKSKKKITLDDNSADLLIKEVIMRQLKVEKEKKNLEIESLNSVVEEFLKTFIIIGYDLDSRPVMLFNAKTQLDADALSTALSKVFADAHRPPNMN